MKRLSLFFVISFILLAGTLMLTTVTFGQTELTTVLRPVREFGAVRPTGVLYEPRRDRFAWTTPEGALEIADARTFQPIRTLYEEFSYSRHYTFSHDGQWLAVANQRQVDLFNVETGALAASIEPNGSRGIQAPLVFSDDDTYLLMSVVVPERQELRRSENDTTITPWLWDLPSAREEARSRLPGLVDALPFFDNRNGFILGPENLIVAALPRRLQLFDLDDDLFNPVGEIVTERFEQDPVDLWFSEFDPLMYHRPLDSRLWRQIDARTAEVTTLSMGAALDAEAMRDLAPLRLSSAAQIIGEANTRAGNSLIRALLGDDFNFAYANHPVTVMLVDNLIPVTVPENLETLLIYVLDESTGIGQFEVIQPTNAIRWAINADQTRIAIRWADGEQPVTIYEIATGNQIGQVVPTIFDEGRRDLLEWAGDELIVGFERFNAETGAVIAQDLRYIAFNGYAFSDDNQRLITWRVLPDGALDWWNWDIETGQVVRRETIRTGNGSILQEPNGNGERYLLSVSTTLPSGNSVQGVEVVDIVGGTRQSLYFDWFLNKTIEQVIPSPNWVNFMVVYAPDPTQNEYPANEIAIYNLEDGERWHFAGADLPALDGRRYGFIDDETAFVSGENYGDGALPDRVYGLRFDPTGVPACLVEAFPDQWTRWIDLWERLTFTLRPERLMRLAQRLCQALPADVQTIEGIFFPTPVPTRPYASPTPAIIAGVPACLTQQYAREAVGYAQSWRELTAGLSPEQIAELETLLCEGLTGGGAPLPSEGTGSVPPSQVYLIDVGSGERAAGSYIPFVPSAPVPNVGIVAEFYRRAQNGFLDSPLISGDGRLVAARTNDGTIQVYALTTAYDVIAALATATVEPQRANDPRSIGVRPTATQPFDEIGAARPTLTPTITPTSPPLSEARVSLPQADSITEFCPASLYSTQNPPPDYTPPGELHAVLRDEPGLWRLNPRTGELIYDETLPPCGNGLFCEYSPGGEWALDTSDRVAVFRPDGRDFQVLFGGAQASYVYNVDWISPDTFAYRYDGYLEGERDLQTVEQQYNVETGEVSAPFNPSFEIRLNELPVEVVTRQPLNGAVFMVRQPFHAGGQQTGYKYFMVDRAADSVEYFARLTPPASTSIETQWHPSGDTLYYRLPVPGEDEPVWFAYDVATRTHARLDTLPSGVWSRDGRYRFSPIRVPDIDERIDDGLFVPSFGVWDRETGAVRRYCAPERDLDVLNADSEVIWSPDSRYVIFSLRLPSEADLESARPRWMILDTQTGAYVEIDHPRALDIDSITYWAATAEETS
ncbi:MAG: hypothetical protein SF162_00590 [bacterium]|nr:hypothetical protein [bacterium]